MVSHSWIKQCMDWFGFANNRKITFEKINEDMESRIDIWRRNIRRSKGWIQTSSMGSIEPVKI